MRLNELNYFIQSWLGGWYYVSISIDTLWTIKSGIETVNSIA